MTDNEPLVVGPFTFGPVVRDTRYCEDVSLTSPGYRMPYYTCKYQFSTALKCAFGRGTTPYAAVAAMLKDVAVWREHIREAARDLDMFLKPTAENWLSRIEIE